MNQKDIRAYLASIGAQGGKIGGASTSDAKKKAVVKNLEKARKKRWSKRKKTKPK